MPGGNSSFRTEGLPAKRAFPSAPLRPPPPPPEGTAALRRHRAAPRDTAGRGRLLSRGTARVRPALRTAPGAGRHTETDTHRELPQASHAPTRQQKAICLIFPCSAVRLKASALISRLSCHAHDAGSLQESQPPQRHASCTPVAGDTHHSGNSKFPFRSHCSNMRMSHPPY